MQQRLEDISEEEARNLRKLDEAKKPLQGPPEEWSLAVYRGVIVCLSRALWGITGVAVADAKKSRDEILSEPIHKGWIDALEDVLNVENVAERNAVDSERFYQAAEFYRSMLDMNYSTIGSLAAALRRCEVPDVLVKDAAAIAYLHKEVREAIKAGYGLKPIEPTKRY